MGEQVVNYRRSVLGQNEQLGRKYLSDSLTNFFGDWAVSLDTLSWSASDLPEDCPECAGKVVHHIAGNWRHLRFIFNGYQHLSNKVAEFWYRCSTSDPKIQFVLSRSYYNNSRPRVIEILNGDGAAPTDWTRVVQPLANFSFGWPTFWGGTYKYTAISEATGIVTWYVEYVDSPPVDLEVAGFNIRRLP